jgi:hypothetical protein
MGDRIRIDRAEANGALALLLPSPTNHAAAPEVSEPGSSLSTEAAIPRFSVSFPQRAGPEASPPAAASCTS